MSENNYLFYKLTNDSKPYKPTSTWCANARYQTNELLNSKTKLKYIPDEILIIKRDFIKGNY